MDYSFSEEQRMSADVVRRLLSETCAPADLRREHETAYSNDIERWRALMDLGMNGVLVPEENGGLGLEMEDFILIAEECGRACLPGPFVEQCGVAIPLLSEFSGTPAAAKWLASALEGEARIALGHSINPFMLDADLADVLVLEHDGEVHLVTPGEVQLQQQPSIDPLRRLFTAQWTPGGASRIAEGDKAANALERALNRAAVLSAAQGVGLAKALLDMSAEYAREREQFGKPIGANQAIKHHLANVQVKIEFAQPVIHVAAAMASGERAGIMASQAKMAGFEAADLAARTGVQVHGAMGYSWEVDVHFFLKRTLALSGTWGSVRFHRKRVCDGLFSGILPTGPGATFAAEAS